MYNIVHLYIYYSELRVSRTEINVWNKPFTYRRNRYVRTYIFIYYFPLVPFNSNSCYRIEKTFLYFMSDNSNIYLHIFVFQNYDLSF